MMKVVSLIVGLIFIWSYVLYPSVGLGSIGLREEEREDFMVFTSKVADLIRAQGTVIGIYEPYYGTFKLMHVFMSPGYSGGFDRFTNTYCEEPRRYEMFVKLPMQGEGLSSCEDYYGIRGEYVGSDGSALIKRCRDRDGNYVYVAKDDGSVLSVSYLDGSLCVRVVSKEYLERFIYRRGVDVSQGEYGILEGGVRNVYFEGITQNTALRMMVDYMFANNVNAGIFTLETIEITKKEKKKTAGLRREITYYAWERAMHYLVIKDVPVGQALGYGYYLVQEGVGSDLTKLGTLLEKRKVSGWVFLGALLIGLVFMAASFGLGKFLALPSMISTTLQTMSAVNMVYQLSSGKVFQVNIGLMGLEAEKLRTRPRNSFGVRRLAERIRVGSVYNVMGLSGYQEGYYTQDAYRRMVQAPGGFINPQREVR